MYFAAGTERRRAQRRRRHRAVEVHARRRDAGRRHPARHDLLARDAAARAARARHHERREAGAARREDRQARFPDAGVIDLVSGIMNPIPGGESYTIASPVAVYKNLAIFPGRTGEHNRWGIPGDLRGFDLLTGKEVWRFHTVPHPGDPNFGTWGLNGWQDRKGPASWQPLTVDTANGLVFVALGNAVDQNYGNSRPGIEPLLRQRRRARRRDRQVQVALPDRAPRHLRRGPERAADVRRGRARTASASRRSSRARSRASSSSSTG